MPVLDEESLLSVQVKYDPTACSCVVVVHSKIRKVIQHRVSLHVALYILPLPGFNKLLKCGNKFYDILWKLSLKLKQLSC